jgi:sterol desaturase/sphingolipid hydroxylase (fatty acid hydroxylase superfamily)
MNQLPTFGDATTRLLAFALIFAGLAAWETWAPRRSDAARPHRWPFNLGLAALNALLVRILTPLSGAGVALIAERASFGALRTLELPMLAEWTIALVVLDGAVYAQHRLFHAVPWLWRWHRLHHADAAFDVTTGLRFHPLEIGASLLYKGAIVAVIGASPAQALMFEVVLNAGAMFSHANVALTGDGWLRRVVVTPDMHRVHHSPVRDEQDSNFGFCLSLWDRLFHTYRRAPRAPHETMRIGVDPTRL